jgi:hypothetical protein
VRRLRATDAEEILLGPDSAALNLRSNNVDTARVRCGAGSYLSTVGCTICPTGTWSSHGSTSCKTCPAGQYTKDHKSCVNCLAGEYSRKKSDACLKCSEGTVSKEKSCACTYCQAGSYADHTLNVCKMCPAGTISDASADSCKSCDPGQYSPAKSQRCMDCRPSFYSPTPYVKCSKCPSGQYSKAKASACSSCSAGFKVNASQTGCTRAPTPIPTPTPPPSKSGHLCEPGYYLDATSDSFECQRCGENTFWPVGDYTCSSCPFLYRVNEDKTGCEEIKYPLNCKPGYYNQYLGGGHYLPYPCTKCPIGSYRNNDEQNHNPMSTCQECPAGSVTNADQSTCVCPAGRYFESMTCKPCAENTYSAAGAVKCSTCAADYEPNEAQTACVLSSTVTPAPTNSPSMLPFISKVNNCKAGTYFEARLDICYPCSQSDEYSLDGASFCLKCPPGYFSNYEHTGCPVTVQPTSKPTLSRCSVGTYLDMKGFPIVCKPCPTGSTSSFDSTKCDQCLPMYRLNEAKTGCEEAGPLTCAPGYYGPYREGYYGSYPCDKCPAGTVRNNDNFPPSYVCQQCPDGEAPNAAQTYCYTPGNAPVVQPTISP